MKTDRNAPIGVFDSGVGGLTVADRVVLMSARPGRVVREYPIDLPRPRRVMDVKFSPRFVALEKALWRDLETQLRQEEAL